jgi:hypothetical protein
MAAEDYNWNSRLCAMFKPSDGSSTIISPIVNMENTIETPSDIIDSIDACNLGRSRGNPRFTFNFEIMALNFSVFRKLYSCALNGTTFDVGMATLDADAETWFIDSVDFIDCSITSTVHTIDNSNKPPNIKFQANCLGVSTTNNGQNIITNKIGSAEGSLS